MKNTFTNKLTEIKIECLEEKSGCKITPIIDEGGSKISFSLKPKTQINALQDQVLNSTIEYFIQEGYVLEYAGITNEYIFTKYPN